MTPAQDATAPADCPFCGGTDPQIADTGSFWVKCSGCFAEGPPAETEDEAIRLWNRATRATSQTPDAVCAVTVCTCRPGPCATQDATALADRIKKHLSVCTKLGLDTVGLFEEAATALRATSQTPDAVREALEQAERFLANFLCDPMNSNFPPPTNILVNLRDALSTPSASAGPQAEALRRLVARAILMGAGLLSTTIDDIEEYQGQTWLGALDEADAIIAAHPQSQQTTVLPAETIAYWFMDNHPGLDLLHADIIDLIDRARIDGARQQADVRGALIEALKAAEQQLVDLASPICSVFNRSTKKYEFTDAHIEQALPGTFETIKQIRAALQQSPATDGAVSVSRPKLGGAA